MGKLKKMLFSKRRATIGFIVDRIDEAGGYQSTLWNAIAKTAEEKDINAICFAGGQLKLSFINGKEIAPNPIYELVSNENIDGLIGLQCNDWLDGWSSRITTLLLEKLWTACC